MYLISIIYLLNVSNIYPISTIYICKVARYRVCAGSLLVVGQGMKLCGDTASADTLAPSRPLSRASRAESMGSLADFSGLASRQICR